MPRRRGSSSFGGSSREGRIVVRRDVAAEALDLGEVVDVR